VGAAKFGDVVVKCGVCGGLLSIACVVVAACGEPLEFADWTLPVRYRLITPFE
jgi:hypothetical protein